MAMTLQGTAVPLPEYVRLHPHQAIDRSKYIVSSYVRKTFSFSKE